LLYNVCPLGQTEWRDNIVKLKQYEHIFNGRRLLLIKTGDGLASFEEVLAEFKGFGPAIPMRVPNVPELGEVAGFVRGLAQLRSLRPGEATFYAHTKGVSYDGRPIEQLAGVRAWRDSMYEHCLGNVDAAEHALEHHPLAGCFRHYGSTHPMEEVDWHYAGAFFWMRHDALFSRDWGRVHQTRYGVEMYPGTHFSSEEGACLYADDVGFNLYEAQALYRCEGCAADFQDVVRVAQNPIRPCPRCYKRRGVLVEVLGDIISNAPLLTELRR
jgi:hypothetical protein